MAVLSNVKLKKLKIWIGKVWLNFLLLALKNFKASYAVRSLKILRFYHIKGRQEKIFPMLQM